MPLNLFRFVDLKRLFHLQPSIAMTTIYFLLVIFGAMLITAIIVKIWQKKNSGDGFAKKLLQKYSVMLTTLGIIGMVLVWFRYERVHVLSARFWLLIWFIGLVTWLVFIFKYQIKVIPKSRLELQKTKEFNKYLPKKK